MCEIVQNLAFGISKSFVVCETRFKVHAVPAHPGHVMLQNTRTKTFINFKPGAGPTAEGGGGDWFVVA